MIGPRANDLAIGPAPSSARSTNVPTFIRHARDAEKATAILDASPSQIKIAFDDMFNS
jgi:hypothetical protein